MKVAVLTCTRDRLDYTKHCFARLREYAGCDYDHYVLDNGSDEDTQDWLVAGTFSHLWLSPTNIGINRGLNHLLDRLDGDYDVVVKFDNDCELVRPDTLRDVCDLVVRGGCILSPRILGLRHPPETVQRLLIGDETILEVPHVGGIFLAAPAGVFDTFRYREDRPTWGGDDSELCQHFRRLGGTCGYVERLEAWHYETTDGQVARYPEYWARKLDELGLLQGMPA